MKVVILVGLVLVFLFSGCKISEYKEKYACNSDSDCVSTCGEGCVNIGWVEGYEDPCVNVRAFDCSCVEDVCYTDGQEPLNS